MSKKRRIQVLSNLYIVLGFFLIILSIIFIAIPVAPYIMYRLNPNLTDEEVDKISREISQQTIAQKTIEEKEKDEEEQIPPLDPTLPEDPYVLIPSIKVSSPIGEGNNTDVILEEGTWIAPGYGTPENSRLPIILAAHRFGYTYWGREKRNRISFFNLPDTDIGDRVEIIWEQRKYIYEIYALDESTFIKDYEADVILYTCKYFNSPQRIFRYAMRVN